MSDSKRMDFSRFPRRALPSHETLFFEDEGSRDLYVLLSGSLGVYRNEVQVATISEPLSLVGEISALTGLPRAATVRALGPTQLVVVNEPENLFEDYPQLGAKLARVLATRLVRMNERFVELRERLGPGVSVGLPAIAANAPEPEVERTLDLALEQARGSGAAAQQARRSSDVPRELVDAISDLLEWDPALGLGT